MSKSLRQVLEKSRELISKRKNWIKDYDFGIGNDAGYPQQYADKLTKEVDCFCLRGAIKAATVGDKKLRRRALKTVAEQIDPDATIDKEFVITEFNDAQNWDRNGHRKIVRKLDAAIRSL
jgi:hypothetical protein